MTRQYAFWLGLAGSLGFLAVSLALFVDVGKLSDALRSANYAYVAPSLVFYFMAVYFRTIRWRVLLRPIMGRTKRPLFPVVVVGYMANNLIPLRIGEVVRCYYVSLREEVSAAGALGTVAVERASDVLALLFLLALTWPIAPLSGAFSGVAEHVPGGAPVLAAAGLLPFLAVAAMVIAVTAISQARALSLAGWVAAPLPEAIRGRALGLIASLLQGMTVVRSPRALLTVFLLSLPVWLLEAAMYGVVALGFDLQSHFGGAMEFVAAILVFTAAANLAGTLPSSAGSLGPFDFFGATALVALGMSGRDASSVAFAYALTVHAALWAPPTLLGAVMLLLDGTSLRRLAGGARRAGSASEEAPAAASQGEGGS